MVATREDNPWTENGSRGASGGSSWLILWRSRSLIGYFAWRDLKLRYRQTSLGVLWVLLQPAASVAVFTLVFQRVAHLDTQGIHYPVFALTGMIVWIYFSTAVMRASNVLVANPSLVTKVYFPRIVAPAAGLVSPLLDLAVSAVLLAALMGYYRQAPSVAVLATPLLVVGLVGTTFGVALWLSALNVRFRDVTQAIGPLLQIGMFASPVAYPAVVASGWTGLVYALNPLVGIIGFGRWAVLGATWPGWPLLVSSASAAAVLIGGLRYFRKAEPYFADVI